MDKELIEKINLLARKQRTEGLTEEERQQQEMLRKQYLTEFKNNFRQMLDNIEVVDGEAQ